MKKKLKKKMKRISALLVLCMVLSLIPAIPSFAISNSYEAESSLNTLTGTAAVTSRSGASGGQIVEYIGDCSGWLTFNKVNVPNAGLYQVTIYYYVEDDRYGKVSVNGGTDIQVDFLGKGDWYTRGTKTITLNLQAGDNTLEFSRDSDRIPDIDRIDVDSSVSYEAESGANTLSGTADITARTGASGGQIVENIGDDVPNWLQFNSVNVATAGKYQVTIYYYSSSTVGCYVSVNGGTAISFSYPGKGNWTTQGTKILILDLQAGDNTLKFQKASERTADIDKIDVDSWVSYEAESGSNTLNGNAVNTSKSGASGGYIVASIGDGANNWLQFNNVNVSSAGIYQVVIYYYSDSDRAGYVSVNGGPDININYQGKGDWNTQGVRYIPLNLQSGNNTIKFYKASARAPDIDRIDVCTFSVPETTSNFEAEATANTLNGSAETTTKTGASGGSIVHDIGDDDSNWLQFNNIFVQSEGVYQVTIYYYSDVNRGCYVSVNNDTNIFISFTSTGSWNTRGKKIITLNLQAGDNKIKFSKTYVRAVDIDNIETDSFKSYEAESNTNSINGTASIASRSGASGGQIVENLGDGPSNTLQFNNIYAPSAGEYMVSIYYYSDSNKECYLKLNDDNDIPINFLGKGDWSTRGTKTIVLYLQTGNNIILFHKASDTTADIDKIDVGLVASYEAESDENTLTGPDIISRTGASGGQVVENIGDGPNWLYFNKINVPKAGKYQVTIYYYSDCDRTGYIEVNGVSNTSISFLGKGNWTTRGTKTVTLNLQEGDNTLKFNRPTDRTVDVDKIDVALSTYFDAESSSYYEAESVSNTIGGDADITARTGASGGQAVENIGDGVGWLQFNNVTVPSAGLYQITVYYYSDYGESCYVSVNGGSGITVSLPTTGSWLTRGTQIITLNLQAGENTLNFYKNTARTADIDRIDVDTIATFEAEDSANILQGSNITIASQATASGYKEVCYVGNGNVLQVNNIYVENNGVYTMNIYYYSSDARSGNYKINGASDVAISFAGMGDWTTRGVKPVSVSLKSGYNTVRFYNSSAYMPDLDKIEVIKAVKKSSRTFEAEASLGTGGTVYNLTLCSNGQAVGSLGSSEIIQFDMINAESEGIYDVAVYYLSETTTSGQYYSVDEEPMDITYPATGSSTNLGVTYISTYFKKGTNFFRLFNSNGSMADIDRICIIGENPYFIKNGNFENTINSKPISYEAELSSNTLGGTASVASKNGASGGKIVEYIGDDGPNYLEFNNVNVPSAGEYQISIYYYFDVDRLGYVSVNSGADIEVDFLGKGNWTTRGTKIITLNLQAGNNTLKFFRFTDRIPDIDKIDVELSNSYEAESESNTLTWYATRVARTGASGGQVVENIGDDSAVNYMQFNNVSATASGAHQITIYYYANQNRDSYISVNGADGVVFAFASTGSWQTRGTKTITLNLQSGSNTVRFYNANTRTIDIDKLDVSTFTIYEAESGANTLNGNAGIVSRSGASGGQVVENIGDSYSNWLQFNNVSVPSAGVYQLIIYYYLDNDSSSSCYVNGHNNKIDFSGKNNWTTRGTKIIILNLKAGNNTLKFKNSTDRAPDIDMIYVQASDNWRFETTAGGEMQYAASVGKDGSNCAVIENNDFDDDFDIRQTVRLEPSTNYILKAYVKVENITISTGVDYIGANLCVKPRPNDTNTIRDQFNYSVQNVNNVYDSDTTETYEWREIELPFLSPATGYADITCRLGNIYNTIRGKLYIDNATIERNYSVETFENTGSNSHVRVHLKTSDVINSGISISQMDAWINHLDFAYTQYHTLINDYPIYGTDKTNICSVDFRHPNHNSPAWAGQPISWFELRIKDELAKIKNGDWSFCVLHEMGHHFDHDSWIWDGELSANFKMYYVFCKAEDDNQTPIMSQGNDVYTGSQELEDFYHSLAPGSYANTIGKSSDRSYHHDALTYIMIKVVKAIGWEPFTEAYQYMENTYIVANPTATDKEKFNEFFTKLQYFADPNGFQVMTAFNSDNADAYTFVYSYI
jgi:hypothetical protein